MKFLSEDDTIVALSSPLGTGAIAVIRVSGKDGLAVVNAFLKREITPEDVRRATFTEAHSPASGQVIDQVVATFFQAPHSYTGEDVVEISCHCNPLIIDALLKAALQQGARMARPGEFTLRAFLNGKLDLSQAEAVAEIINSRTRQSLSQSLRHLEGRLSERITALKTDILDHLALLEINLDFSDEEIEALPVAEMADKMAAVVERIEALLRTYDYGRLLQEGIKLLILGKPNVGKSSLLNLLLQRERAIVSEIPGTTRDYIEASLEIEGLAVQAVDTAGIRQTDDAVEAIGVQRALAQIQSADIALAVFEAHRPLDGDDAVLVNLLREHREEIMYIGILNKTDLGRHAETEQRLRETGLPVVSISVTENRGLETLKQTIKEQLLRDQSMETEEIVVTSARHKTALEQTAAALRNAIEAARLRASEEIIAVDVRLALDHLGEITGETTSEDVINHIFANFCIGK